MFKRLVLLTTLAVLLLGMIVVVAKDGSKDPQPTNGYIFDGRLNGADVAAPVAVFYKYDALRLPGDWTAAVKEVKVLRGVELLAIDPKTNSGKLALEVSAADIAKVVDNAKHKDGTLIKSQNGYSLFYSKDNWFWIVSPPDKEGKTYTFEWQNLTVPHD